MTLTSSSSLLHIRYRRIDKCVSCPRHHRDDHTSPKSVDAHIATMVDDWLTIGRETIYPRLNPVMSHVLMLVASKSAAISEAVERTNESSEEAKKAAVM